METCATSSTNSRSGRSTNCSLHGAHLRLSGTRGSVAGCKSLHRRGDPRARPLLPPSRDRAVAESAVPGALYRGWHDRYRPLAWCPEIHDRVHSGGELQPAPSILPRSPWSESCSTPLPNFQSRTCNVGLDETFDLGHGRSAAAAMSAGRTASTSVRTGPCAAPARGVRMQFWGDVILSGRNGSPSCRAMRCR